MLGRLTLLGVMLATLPLAVDVPASRDTTRAGQLQVEVAGGGGQFAIVSRGCNGEVLHVTHNQLRSGALVVEERLPGNYVVGVRAGSVNTRMNSTSLAYAGAPTYQLRDSAWTRHYSNNYVNPYVGYEGRLGGIGAGALMADQPFLFASNGNNNVGYVDFHKVDFTAHVRLGPPTHQLTLRWMEDLPLESEGHLSVDIGGRPARNVEAGAFAGLLGPYDGAMFGVRGRLWVTPDAALQIKASTSAKNSEYGVYGSVTARLPGGR